MSWILYLFGSGQALFLGAAMVLTAVALLPRVRLAWQAMALAILARLGIFVAVISAVPLSYWLYGLAIVVTAVWLWRQRRRGHELLQSGGGSSLQSTGAAKTPDPLALRRATAVIWLGIVLLELPHQVAPRLAPFGDPPLYILGDSVTAGMGAGEKHTWPDLLPPAVNVHNFAQPGANTATALKSQASQLPAGGGLVILEIGGNDLLGETSSAEFQRDLDRLLSRVCAADRTVVMFELPLPPLCNEYGRIQRRLAAKYQVRLIPKRVLISVLAHGGATLDTIHLSESGHQQMADTVWAVIGPAYD